MARKAGLHYRWQIPGKRPLNILQTIGNGGAFLDYDNDGNLDILLVGPKLALYRGDGHGHFTEVTTAMGLAKLSGHFLGCAVGDYDNDGYEDLYITAYRGGLLLHNAAGKRLRDVTAQAGLASQPWGTSCAFADFDGDGFLDLFIGNYARFDATSPQLCPQGGILTSCSPTKYVPLPGVLYHNLSGRRFEEVARGWHVKTSGNTLGAACADFDGSGRIGLAVANDELDGDLFRKQHAGHFTNINVSSGTATDRFGHRHGGMGIDWGDYDNDGRPDLFVTTFAHEDKCLYRNLGEGVFEERGVETGVASALEPYVSFGCKFADFDNDGWLDLMIASGHVQDNIARIKRAETYRQPLEMLRNTGGHPAAFVRVTGSASLDKLAPMVGRGLAVGDYDNDGRMDALVVDSEGPPRLLHNETGTGRQAAGGKNGSSAVPNAPACHWLGLTLIGTGRSNRDAYGASVTLEAGSQRQVRLCRTDGSYLSASEKRVHIGLGPAAQVEKLTVRWPSGRVESYAPVQADRYLMLREGAARAAPATASAH
jgi:hypothetical protein